MLSASLSFWAEFKLSFANITNIRSKSAWCVLLLASVPLLRFAVGCDLPAAGIKSLNRLAICAVALLTDALVFQSCRS